MSMLEGKRSDGWVFVSAASFAWRAWSAWCADHRVGDLYALIEAGSSGRRGAWLPLHLPPGDYDTTPAEQARFRKLILSAIEERFCDEARGVVLNFGPVSGTGAG